MQNGTQVEMVKREEPRFVRFSTGDVVEGVLAQIERVEIQGKPAVRYTVAEDGGTYVQFLGTHQISTKLRTTDKGHRVEIRCTGEDTMIKRGESCMKVFDVLVSKNVVCSIAAPLTDDGLTITNDDIPF